MMTDMFLQIDNSKAGKYAFALTGRGLPRYTRLPRVPLRLPWAKRSLGFQPVIPDGPFVPDFVRQTGHLKKSLIRQFVINYL